MKNNNVDIKYLVGLFEGEGYVGVRRQVVHPQKSKHGISHHCEITLSMTDIEPIQALCDYFGGEMGLKKNNRETCRDLYEWKLFGRNAATVAQKLLPYILTPRKRGALQCVIDFGETISDAHRGRLLDCSTFAKREALYHKCKFYNARGSDASNRSNEALLDIEQPEVETQQLYFL